MLGLQLNIASMISRLEMEHIDDVKSAEYEFLMIIHGKGLQINGDKALNLMMPYKNSICLIRA